MSSRAPWILRLVRTYFPAALRDAYGDDLEAFWIEQACEPRYQGWVGRLRLSIHLIIDVLRTAMSQRTAPENSSVSPRRRSRRSLGSDLKYALRSLRRAPLYSSVAIVTLALGIGATTALYTVVDGVLLRPLPYPDSDELVWIARTTDEGEPDEEVAWPDFDDWRTQATGFAGMAAYVDSELPFEWDEVTESVSGARVTRDYFEVMGIPVAQGRTFSIDEDRSGGANAIIISHDLWQTRLGGDPDVLTQTLRVNSEVRPIVGVMPPGFAAPYRESDYWIPMQADDLLAEVGLPTGTRTLSFLNVVGRLSGMNVPVAEASLQTLVDRIDTEVGREDPTPVRVLSLQESVVGDVGLTLWVLMGAVALVMIVACANVAGLSLSRTNARSREAAVRSALGATRAHLMRLVFTESLVLALAAAALGAFVAFGLSRVVVALAPPGLPRLDEISLTATGLLFAVGLTVVAALLFGLIPAIRTSRPQLAEAMSSGSRGSSANRRAMRPQRLLVVGQVATAVVLLCGATLLGNSLTRLMTVERGFDEGGVLVATVLPSEARYETPEQIDLLYEEILTNVRALPSVVSASSTYSPPLYGNEFRTRIRLEEEDESVEGHWAGTVIIRDGYFETSGTRLLRGRTFSPDDRLGEPLVAIVNETMAESLWPGEDPIGRRFHFNGGLSGSADSFDRAFFPREGYTVVGIAEDIRRTDLGQAPAPEYYRPHKQITWGTQFVLVRSSGDPAALAGPIREAVRRVDRTIPEPEIRTQADQVSESLAAPRFRTLLVGGFAVLTCLLAMVGLYAVMAMAVAQRTREMGVRLALGATPGSLRRSVLGGGIRLVAAGVVLGLFGAFFGTRWITSLLFEVTTSDPLSYAFVVGLTGIVALSACYVPAARASRVDPVISLKAE